MLAAIAGVAHFRAGLGGIRLSVASGRSKSDGAPPHAWQGGPSVNPWRANSSAHSARGLGLGSVRKLSCIRSEFNPSKMCPCGTRKLKEWHTQTQGVAHANSRTCPMRTGPSAATRRKPPSLTPHRAPRAHEVPARPGPARRVARGPVATPARGPAPNPAQWPVRPGSARPAAGGTHAPGEAARVSFAQAGATAGPRAAGAPGASAGVPHALHGGRRRANRRAGPAGAGRDGVTTSRRARPKAGSSRLATPPAAAHHRVELASTPRQCNGAGSPGN